MFMLIKNLWLFDDALWIIFAPKSSRHNTSKTRRSSTLYLHSRMPAKEDKTSYQSPRAIQTQLPTTIDNCIMMLWCDPAT